MEGWGGKSRVGWGGQSGGGGGQSRVEGVGVRVEWGGGAEWRGWGSE